ncbi:MAG: succinylglutamate desuccinylase/aspartoacylase family protein [Chromatiales bacterium]|nr:succinylglutamate desuccinylase/aspartoacylase family protein [Chromatiales bacterium]
MLNIFESIPDGLLDADATELEALLGGPSVIHLNGRQQPALFVSVLMHGNETTGFEAVKRWLRRYEPGGGSKPMPRALTLFIGNVSAARQGMRRLAEQPDYNRVWPSGGAGDTAEHRLMVEVMAIMRARGVFASVDVHNNTGLNPHYACVNRIDYRFLHLATLFSRQVVYFIRPAGVQSMSFAELAPAVTLECGQPGQPHGTEHALEYLDACLNLAEIPDHPVADGDLDLFHTVAVVKVPESVSLGFEDGVELRLVENLDRMNFNELLPGTAFANVTGDVGLALDVCGEENDEDVAHRYFVVEDGQIRTRVPVMPSMLTQNVEIIRQDCLCYLMERYRLA